MKYAEIEWRDGQPYSPGYDDIYYSTAGGREESEYVFLKHNYLARRWQKLGADDHFVIAETGFGTGLNFVLTLQAWAEQASPEARLHYVAIEKHPVSPEDIKCVARNWPELAETYDELLSVYPLPVEGEHCRSLLGGRVQLHLVFADVIAALKSRELQVDAWYLDGFGPDKNADLWSDQVFSLIEKNSKQGATLSTYTAAGFVRRGLQAAGFEVNKVKGHGKKREMITAVLKNKKLQPAKTPWYTLEKTNYKNKKAVIIGAGLIGLTTAWSLVQRGWQVTVIEKHGNVAEEASGNPAGLLMLRLAIDNKNDTAFYTSAMLYASHCLDKLQQDNSSQSDEKFWFYDGVYSIFKAGKAEKIIEAYGFPEQFMEVLAEHDLQPHLKDKNVSVSFLREAGWASPKKTCEALVQACGQSLKLIHQNVDDIRHTEGEWQALDKKFQVIASAEVLVVANGVDVNQFEIVSWLPVSSVRGQLTEVTASETSLALNKALSFDAYVTPEYKGKHYVGATYRVSDKNQQLTQEEQDENLHHLEQCLPNIFDKPEQLNGRVGFRPVSNDMTPIIGEIPDKQAFKEDYKELHHGRPRAQYPQAKYLSGLYVNAAHGSRGICSSFLSAEILAAMIVNEPLPVSKEIVDHLSPARFLMRKLKRGDMAE
ncbi:MAG: bifunctional tRNA (5-methylaminomethyl-2-thiouridine)(34)-methyltransferase MnmD/FAD-dependent 5-carboxymethylaminomethyl-2-thiouridine(34) oxidoreductase MnmC [Gammaproteobacteria bacterium]|nr:bifunctional tRNA (5-methylaminomethyl-2-thiouridine)(34)-methyltransferase MnmD/FAD-dependent 5-carboxymethylaminomethyl-2-thiouridine(34) oxidoreductase MnmC [Gammaproteobacteria bacterium]